mgnify:CR=1 FL=1
MGRRSGGVVRQGVNGTAVHHAIGVAALRPDVQLEHRPVLFHRLQLNVVVEHKGVFPHPVFRVPANLLL